MVTTVTTVTAVTGEEKTAGSVIGEVVTGIRTVASFNAEVRYYRHTVRTFTTIASLNAEARALSCTRTCRRTCCAPIF